MAMKHDHNLMTYAVKKNHMQIYTEFLNFQTLGSSRLDEPVITPPSIYSKNEKKLNLRNFRALYWIVLYLKNIKGNSLGLIHEFFLHKQWTTWQFKNFSYHYHRLMKLEHIHQEILHIQQLILQDEGLAPTQNIGPVVIERITEPVSKQETKLYKPLMLGAHQNADDRTIRPNCSIDESLDRLKELKIKSQS